MENRPIHFAINVMTRDRVGIIADVSQALYALGGNLEALSQTVVHGWFTMIIVAAFPKHVTEEDVRRVVEGAGEFSATVRPSNEVAAQTPAAGEPYVATVVGEDKPGIVRRLTRAFADSGVNIEDVWNEVRDERFIIIFSVTVPVSLDAGVLRGDLEQAAADLGMSLMLQHQDVFTATNSLDVHSRTTGKA